MSQATAPAADLLSVSEAEIDRELCRRSLGEFIRSAWHVLEPATEYVHGWHIDALVEHLEAVEARQIRNLVINIPPRYMKLIADSQPLLTPDGWREHGDLQVGDEVFGPDGEPVRVVRTSEPGTADMEMHFTNGEVVKCNRGHLWTLYDRSCRKWTTRTTESLTDIKVWSGDRARFQLPDTKAVEFPTRDLPIPPYFLGAWLGDGTATKPAITHSPEGASVVDRAASLGYEPSGAYEHPTGTSVRTEFWGQGIQEALRRLGVHGDKHIPEMYRRSSIDQRLQLLAGIIDTDGHCDENGRITIVSGNRTLVDDIVAISSGLGWRPYIVDRHDPGGFSPEGSSYWAVGFNPTHDLPLSVERKRPTRRAVRRRIGLRRVVRSDDPEPGQCITVGREDGLYMVGESCIPTHNSMAVCVFFPAWVWTRDPSARFLTASYKEGLANRDAGKMRRLVKNDWYQRRWGHCFDFRADQDVKTHFENTRGGHRVSFGAGTGTGEGGDFVIVDDPHDVEKAESRKEREATLQWWDEVMSTRLNDPRTGCKVIVMQRLHQRDLTAHVLEQGGYEHLMIPTEYDPDRHCSTSIGWEDPRDEEGELAWPERFGAEAVAERKKRLGPHGVAGQLQQRPTSRSGGLFQEDWFRPPVAESDVPSDCDWIRYWDKAATEGGGSYTVGLLMAREPDAERAWVVDVVRGQWAAAKREEKIDETAGEDAQRLGGKTEFRVRVEQEPGAGGKESALATKRRLSRKGYSVGIDNPASQGNKFVRADPLSGAAQTGDVKVVEGPWNQAFLRELGQAGPGAEYLDQMDAAAGAYNALAEEGEDEGYELQWV